MSGGFDVESAAHFSSLPLLGAGFGGRTDTQCMSGSAIPKPMSRGGARGGKARLGSDPYRKPSDIVSGGFLHPLALLLCIQCTLACFCRRLRQSAIMAMNSEFVGLPLMFETV